jgi:hypothetical protein
VGPGQGHLVALMFEHVYETEAAQQLQHQHQ